MGLEKKVGIVYRDESVVELLVSLTEGYGYATCTMVVNERTSTTDVLQFLNTTMPDLLILKANYGSIEDISEHIDLAPDVEAVASIVNDVKKAEGLAALKEIRKQYPELPVLMSTSDSVLGESAVRSGANNYISFPTDLGRLKQTLDTYLKPKNPQS